MIMRKLAVCAALFAVYATAQTVQTFPGSFSLPNDQSYGTSLGRLAKLTNLGTAIIIAKGDRSGIVGLVVAGAGTTGSASIASWGIGNCAFDGPTQAGNYVQSSPIVAGDCTDAGSTYPNSGQVIGRLASTNAFAGSYNLTLFPAEIRAIPGSSGGPSGNATTILSVAVTGTPTDGQTWIYNAAHQALESVPVAFWRKFTITYGQLSGFNATTGSITLFPRTARQKVCGVSMTTTFSFAGPGITAITATVGDSNSLPNLYTPNSFDLDDNGTADAVVFGSAQGSSNVQANFVSGGSNLSALNSGSIDISVCTVQLQ